MACSGIGAAFPWPTIIAAQWRGAIQSQMSYCSTEPAGRMVSARCAISHDETQGICMIHHVSIPAGKQGEAAAIIEITDAGGTSDSSTATPHPEVAPKNPVRPTLALGLRRRKGCA